MREYLLDNSVEITTDPDSALDADFISFESLDNIEESMWDIPHSISRQA
jgi:hypothetical protein